VFIYLFRDERTDNRALAMDVTGRNIPPVTSPTVWLFVEVIDTQRTSATVGHRVFAIRGAPGEDDRLLSLRCWMGITSSNANLLMRWILTPKHRRSERAPRQIAVSIGQSLANLTQGGAVNVLR
jgi:hypothetical protein